MCEACLVSKMKESSHPTKDKHKATAPYERLWSDLAGPLDTETRNGEKYVLGIVCEYTRYLWIYLLKNKSDATAKFDEFLTRHSGVKHLIQTVSTDQGGEYSGGFNLMLSRHQLKHWLTAANSPASRGTIERVWGTILPSAACNLRYSGLVKDGLDLWGYALTYSVWCYNRVTHAGDTMTPYEHLNHEKPDVSHARVWGCPCFAHVSVSQQVKSPAKEKSLRGIFLGRHEVDGLTADGDMVLLSNGEIINSHTTSFCEDWKLMSSPAEAEEAESADDDVIPSGKRVIVSLFDGMSCLAEALHKNGTLQDYDLYVAVEIDEGATQLSKALFANLGLEIPVYRGFKDVRELTPEKLKALGTVVLLGAGPLCEDFSRKRLLKDYTGKVPTTDPRPGLDGEKGKLFRTTIEIYDMCVDIWTNVYYFIENVVFDDMVEHWEEVCKRFGTPYVINAKDFSFTSRYRAYWCNFPIPDEVLEAKQPKMNWDEACMDAGRQLLTRVVYDRKVVPTIGKSWCGTDQNPKEQTSTPVWVKDRNSDKLQYLRPHEAEKLLGHAEGVTEGIGIGSLQRLKGLGNGWDMNVVSLLLGFLPTPNLESTSNEGEDWCLQFKAGDRVKVWTDTTTPPAWYEGVIKHVCRNRGVRVEYPPSEDYPNGSHTNHDTDDGNIMFSDKQPQETEAPPEVTADLNSMLEAVKSRERTRLLQHPIKTRPDRWTGQSGNKARSNKPYLNYQTVRWAEYHKSNPPKGKEGHVTYAKFAKMVAEDWDKLVQKGKQLHEVTKVVDEKLRASSKEPKCHKCGKTQSEFASKASFQSHKSRCRVTPNVATAALAMEKQTADDNLTYRVDCEQAGSDWTWCSEGQEVLGSEQSLVGEIPLPARRIRTEFTHCDGSKSTRVDDGVTHYVGHPEIGSVTKRVTIDDDTDCVIQDLDMNVSTAAAAAIKKQMIRGIDLEVTLNSESKVIAFANAAAQKRKTVRDPREPQTMKEALTGADKEKWAASIKEEWDALVDQGVFSLVPRSETRGKCVITSKWVFKIKGCGRYKSRCVGRGFQQWNSTIDGSFAPVARLGTVRMLLALAALHGLDLWQMDICTAFLNAKLGANDTVYMEVPECYADQFPDQVLKLNRAIYGLKSAPRLWNKTLDAFFSELGFEPSPVDPCLYILRKMMDGVEETVYIVVYVDDLCFVSTNADLRNEVRKSLKERFQMSQKIDSIPSDLLGMHVTVGDGFIEIDQSAYALQVYNNYRDWTVDVRAAPTPMKESTKLSRHDRDDD